MKSLRFYDPSGKDSLGQFRGGGRIMQILKENFPDAEFISDLSHAQNFESTLFIPSWQPFEPSRLGKPIAKTQILMIFDVIPVKFPEAFSVGVRGSINLWQNKRALKNFDKIITISEHSKRDIVQYLGIPADKVAVVYPTVSKIFLNTKPQTLNSKQIQNTKYQILNTKYLLYVGDVNWNKNLVMLAKAIKLANVTCVFVGKPFSLNTKYEILNTKTHPWQKEFRDFLQETKDDKRFIFLGYVPDSELIALYQNAATNILVSRDEGFGYSYVEAATQKCPSVLSDVDIFREIAGDAALFADPKDPNDIADKIIELYFDKKKRDALGEKACKRSQFFSPKAFRDGILKNI